MNTFTLYYEPKGLPQTQHAGYDETDFDEDNQYGTPRPTLAEAKQLQKEAAQTQSNVIWNIFEREPIPYPRADDFTVRRYKLLPCLKEIHHSGWHWQCVYEYDGPND